MLISFSKYQGAGNDFIMIDAINQEVEISSAQIKRLCDRKFGIGADGLIILTQIQDTFHMNYYNSDGNESTMCGNGGRSFIQFLSDHNYINQKVTFSAIDGNHEGFINKNLSVSLQLKNVDTIKKGEHYTFLDTGSPHHIEFKKDIDHLNLKKLGSQIRYSDLYPEGTNVNFVEVLAPDKIKVRTYERGVEDETLSCGTGVTAAAIASHYLNLVTTNTIKVETKGGSLQVSFTPKDNHYAEVWLTGPAEKVFTGEIEL